MSKKKNKQELKERNRKYVRNYRENLKTDPKMATKYETMKEKEGKCQQKIREERKERAQNDSKFRDFLRKKECERKRIQRKKNQMEHLQNLLSKNLIKLCPELPNGEGSNQDKKKEDSERKTS